jgi:hypothetical protein
MIAISKQSSGTEQTTIIGAIRREQPLLIRKEPEATIVVTTTT